MTALHFILAAVVVPVFFFAVVFIGLILGAFALAGLFQIAAHNERVGNERSAGFPTRDVLANPIGFDAHSQWEAVQ